MTTTEQAGLAFGPALQTKVVDHGWAVEGYASTWELDQVGDRVEPGAFRDSIAANPRPPLLWSHDQSRVIGRAEQLQETREGLWGRWKISRTRDGEDARQLLLDEAVGGLSIGYRVATKDLEHRGGVRHLRRVSLLEVSVCALPANLGARVTAVKAAPRRSLTREYLEAYVARLKAKQRIARMGPAEVERELAAMKLRLRTGLLGAPAR